MPDHEYCNARLRAMRSRLLGRAELVALCQVGSVPGLLAALAGTAYRQAVQAAMLRGSGMECLTEALRRDMVEVFSRLRRFCGGTELRLVATVWRAHDVHNLKAILGGLAKRAPPEEITAALLPAGELSAATLAELARAANLGAALDMLGGANPPIAQALARLEPWQRLDTTELDLALDRWHARQARWDLADWPEGRDVLAAAADIEADLANLLTVLRLAAARAGDPARRGQPGRASAARLFRGSGRLRFELLQAVAEQNTLVGAIQVLAGTAYYVPLQAGLAAYSRSGRLGDIERQLRLYRLHWLAGLAVRDPLGPGMLLAYLALKTSEVSNLRWVAEGISLGLAPQAIGEELELAA